MDETIGILERNKERLPLSDSDLFRIQLELESCNMKFIEESLHKTEPNIIRMLIKEGDKNAKEYLRQHAGLDDTDTKVALSEFGHYTIEGIIVYVLARIFSPSQRNCESFLVRASSLVEQLEHSVRIEAFYLNCRRKQIKVSEAGEVTKAKFRREEEFQKKRMARLESFLLVAVYFVLWRKEVEYHYHLIYMVVLKLGARKMSIILLKL